MIIRKSLSVGLAIVLGISGSNFVLANDEVSLDSSVKIDRKLIDEALKMSWTENVGENVRKPIDDFFRPFLNGYSVKGYGPVSSDLIELKSEYDGVAYHEIDFSLISDENDDNLNQTIKILQDNSEKRVLCIKNLDCSKYDVLVKIIKDTKNLDNILIYIERFYSGSYHSERKGCKDCEKLSNLVTESNGWVGLYDKIFDYRQMMLSSVKNYLISSFENIKKFCDVNIDDNELDILSKLLNGHGGIVSSVTKVLRNSLLKVVPNGKSLTFGVIFSEIMSNAGGIPLGFSQPDLKLNPEKEMAVCLHEIGHAVLAYLGDKRNVDPIIVGSSTGGGCVFSDGFNTFGEIEDELPWDTLALQNCIKTFLAGYVVDRVLSKNPSLGSSYDLRHVKMLLENLAIVNDPLLKYDDQKLKDKVIDLYYKYDSEVEETIRGYEVLIRRLAKELFDRPLIEGIKYISGEEFRSLFEKTKNDLIEEGKLSDRCNQFINEKLNGRLNEDFVKYIESYKS